MSDSPAAERNDRDELADERSEEWIAEQLAKAPRHLNQQQAHIARRLRTRVVPAEERRRPA